MLTQTVGIASTVVDVIPSRVAFRVVIMRRLPRLRPLIAIAIASPLGAQGLCWTARPSPACPAWIVTEIGGELPVYSTSVINRSETRRDFGQRIVTTLGVMVNSGDAHALGITGAGLNILGDSYGGRLELAYRQWRGTRSGFSLSAGVTQSRIPGKDRYAEGHLAAGITAGVTLDSGWYGVSTRLDATRVAEGRPVALYLGGRLSEKAAPVAAVSGVVLAWLGYALSPGPK